MGGIGGGGSSGGRSYDGDRRRDADRFGQRRRFGLGAGVVIIGGLLGYELYRGSDRNDVFRRCDRNFPDFDYETGHSRSSLTGTDPGSWRDKSWVVGVTVNSESRGRSRLNDKIRRLVSERNLQQFVYTQHHSSLYCHSPSYSRTLRVAGKMPALRPAHELSGLVYSLRPDVAGGTPQTARRA